MSTGPVTFKRKVLLSPVLNADSVTPRTAGFANTVKLAALREGYQIPKSLAETFVDTTLDSIAGELLEGRHVNIRQVGTFKLIIRNLKDGTRVLRVKFITAPGFKAKLAERRV